MNRLIILILIIAGTLLVGQGFLRPDAPASSKSDTAIKSELPSRRLLQRSGWNSGGWLILYDQRYPTLASILKPLQEQSFRGTTVFVHDLQSAPDSLLQRYPTLIISNELSPAIRQQLEQLPALSLAAASFTVDQTTLSDSLDLAQFSYLPGAWQDTLPMHLIWGGSETPLVNYVQERLERGFRSLFWSSWGYEVLRNGEAQFVGYFNDSTWVMDRQTHFDFAQAPTSNTLQEVAHFEGFDGASAEPDRTWQEQLRSVKQSIEAFCGQANLPPMEVKIYPTVERKALRTNSMQQVHLDEQNGTVHLVNSPKFGAQEWSLPYCAWLQAALGKPQQKMLEIGLSYQWAGELRGRPWRSWVRQLAEADALPPADLLLDERRIQEEFPLIGHLAAGALVDYYLSKGDKDSFLTAYQHNEFQLSNADYRAWLQWIKTNYPTATLPKQQPTQARLHGFTLAHEGYRVYNGYGGGRAAQSIQEMQQIGIDAVAIVPYSYMANPNRPDPIPVSRSAGSENDEAVLFSHFAAQEQGQYTLLKPQIWLGRGSWPGDVRFDKDQDWQAFFTYYKRWIIHYALLAEMYGFDGLCIGTEFRHTTLEKPDDWRALIQDIRKIYRGDLTYAANWGEECEQLSFWEALDFVGVNCYYPLHKDEGASDQDLQKGAQRVVDKLESIQRKAQRPVWLTEIGYRSATAPWQSPHAEAGQRAIDDQAQARCYEAILAATYQKDWIKGYFWWKWPSDLSHDESNGRGYMPVGKPAQAVLSRYYEAGIR